MSSGVDIIIRGKNAASQAFSSAGRDLEDLSNKSKDSADAIADSSKAIKQAISGDLVGAVQTFIKVWKDLGKALLANPFGAVIAGVTMLVGGLSMAIGKFRELRQAKEEAAAAAAEEEAKNAEAEKKAAEEREKRGVKWHNRMEKIDGVDTASDTAIYLASISAGKSREELERERDRLLAEADEARRQAQRANSLMQSSETPAKWEQERDRQTNIFSYLTNRANDFQQILDNMDATQHAAEEAAAKQADEQWRFEEWMSDFHKRLRQEADEARAAQKQANDDALAAAEKEAEAKQKTVEQAEEALRLEQLKGDVQAANAVVSEKENALAAARQAWEARGISGLQARRAARKAAAAEERNERQLQRQLGRWERGARDNQAQAAHDLQMARDAAAIAQDNAAAAAAALKAENDRREAEKLAALNDLKRSAAEAKDKLDDLKTALVG